MVPGVGWGGGMEKDESALMFCKILPSSSILSCFLCLNLFLTGGDRMFSLKKSFLELQKSYKVSCGKLAFRYTSGHILFASSLKLWNSSLLPKMLFFPWAPLSSSARQRAQKCSSCCWPLHCTEGEQLPVGVLGSFSQLEPCPWHCSLPDPSWARGSPASWPASALLDVELWIPCDILSPEPLQVRLCSFRTAVKRGQAGVFDKLGRGNSAVRITQVISTCKGCLCLLCAQLLEPGWIPMLGEQTHDCLGGVAVPQFMCPQVVVAQVCWNLPCLLWFPSCGSSVNLDENVGSLSDCGTARTEEKWLSLPEKSTRELLFAALGPGAVCGPGFHVRGGTGERKRSCLVNQVLVSLFSAMLSTLEVVFECWFWRADPPPPE